MKLSRILVIFGGIGLIILLNLFLSNEEEREISKLKKLESRNILEKQLVGKWNHTDFPAGLENGRNYHLLSADASYTYRGSDKSKSHGGYWLVRVADSLLYLNLTPQSNSKAYRITDVRANQITLRQIEDDSLSNAIEWFRHP